MILLVRGVLAALVLTTSLSPPSPPADAVQGVSAPTETAHVDAIVRSGPQLFGTAPVEPSDPFFRPIGRASHVGRDDLRARASLHRGIVSPRDERVTLRRVLPGRRTPRLAPTEPPRH